MTERTIPHGTPSVVPRRRETCRVCGSAGLSPVLDLGETYVAGLFFRPEERALEGAPHPLELVRCSPDEVAGACGLVQLRHTVPPETMYSSYWYRSGINRSMTVNLHEIAAQACELVGPLAGDDLLVDIGCNDGTLLDAYRDLAPAAHRLGVDPSDVAAHAEAKGHDVLRDFFSAQVVREHSPDRRVRVVTSIAMFYDLEDPSAFVRDIAALLAPDGIWVSEFAYLPAMLQTHGFDGICHEHLEYYSLAVFERLLHQEGLTLHRVETNSVNGGSIRCFASLNSSHFASGMQDGSVDVLRASEEALALDTAVPYEQFAEGVLALRDGLLALLRTLSEEGKVVHGYGASTKGNTILQFLGIDRSLVACIADRNPDKWGAETIGTHIPIVSEDDSRSQNPDFYLTLPWHFLPEFLERESDFLERGGRFIVPFPHPHLEPPGK